MQKRHRFATSAAITATVILGLAGTGAGALYASTTTGGSGPEDQLVTAIAKKFNLKESDVQQVFDEQREQKKAELEQKAQEKLTKAVKAGTLTQAQADAITEKRKKMKELFPFGGPRMGHGHQGFRGASGHNEREIPDFVRPTPKAQ